VVNDFDIKGNGVEEEEKEKESQRIHNSINEIKELPGNSTCADCKTKGRI